MARPKKQQQITAGPEEYAMIRAIVDDMMLVADLMGEDDFSGHKMTAKYGYLCRLVDELNTELRLIEQAC
jgi:hypothetical protein